MLWSIDAVQVGEFRGVPEGVLFLRKRSSQKLDFPVIMFVVRSGDTTVVIDTGGGTDHERVSRDHFQDYVCTPEMHPLSRLAELSVDPEEVALVVNTHLHWDHASNNHLFPNAEVVIQREELNYAVHPCPAHRNVYAHLDDRQPPWLPDLGRLRVVSGEKELLPGLRVVPLPGHTPGSQGLVVETVDGPYVLMGDCAYRFENITAPEGVVPNSSFVNLIDFYESLERVRESGWKPLPAHDERVVAASPYGRRAG